MKNQHSICSHGIIHCAVRGGRANQNHGLRAFDALPAFLAAFLMGPLAGAVVGAIGISFSALFAGFPLTLPLHIAIALEMAAICAFVGGWLHAKT